MSHHYYAGNVLLNQRLVTLPLRPGESFFSFAVVVAKVSMHGISQPSWDGSFKRTTWGADTEKLRLPEGNCLSAAGFPALKWQVMAAHGHPGLPSPWFLSHFSSSSSNRLLASLWRAHILSIHIGLISNKVTTNCLSSLQAWSSVETWSFESTLSSYLDAVAN